MFEATAAQKLLDQTMKMVKAAKAPVILRRLTLAGSDVAAGKLGTQTNFDRVLKVPPMVDELTHFKEVDALGLVDAKLGDVVFKVSATDIPEGESYVRDLDQIIYGSNTMDFINYMVETVAGVPVLYYIVGRGKY